MYQTILVTLDATPTDRAIIEHVKQLAAEMHSRVVLLHVATGVPASSTARTPRVKKSRKIGRTYRRFRVSSRRGDRCAGRARVWRSCEGDSPLGRRDSLRPRGHEHARPQAAGGLISGNDRQSRAAQHQRAGAAAPCTVTSGRLSPTSRSAGSGEEIVGALAQPHADADVQLKILGNEVFESAIQIVLRGDRVAPRGRSRTTQRSR